MSMTENERVLRDIIIDGNGFDYDESIPKSIFDELLAYRAIGTVEQLNTLQQDYWKLNEVCKEYSAIGTIEEFKALKEKQIAKKPHRISEIDDNDNAMVECPICHANSDYSVKTITSGYCWKCGQKLDWQ